MGKKLVALTTRRVIILALSLDGDRNCQHHGYTAEGHDMLDEHGLVKTFRF